MLLKSFAYSFISWAKASFEPRPVLFSEETSKAFPSARIVFIFEIESKTMYSTLLASSAFI